MEVKIDSSHIHEVLKLSKADNISFINLSGVTNIIAHDVKDTVLKVQIVKKISVHGILGQTLINREVLKLLPKNSEVKITDNSLSSGNRKISYLPSDLTDKPIYVEEPLITLNSEELNDLLTCSHAIAQDETRPVLTGVCIYDNVFAALDGFRLSIRRSNFEAKEQVIVSKDIIEIIKKIKYKGEVKIYFNESYVKFTFGDLEVTGNRITEEYIKYKSLIPEEFRTEVNVEPEKVLALLKSYKDINARLVKLNFLKDNILLTASNKNTTIEDKLAAVIEGENLEIAFNPNYLIDALKNYKDEVVLKLISPVSPMVITDNSNRLDLVLPVRISTQKEEC